MKNLRLLLGNVTPEGRRLVSEMVRGEEDIEIVGEAQRPMELLLAVRETEADAVVVALETDEEAGVQSHLLAEYPSLTILEMRDKGEAVYIEQLCPLRVQVAAESGESLVTALRTAVRSRCAHRRPGSE